MNKWCVEIPPNTPFSFKVKDPDWIASETFFIYPVAFLNILFYSIAK
ncbi:MAG: hypothetical protein ACTSRZ_08115 [Promethearchaeota archaeon]